MSGEPAVAIDGPGLAPLGEALVMIAGIDGDHVLVGGLAVMIRVAAGHRATSDLDLVAELETVAAAATTIAGVTRTDRTHLDVDGVTVDMMRSTPTPPSPTPPTPTCPCQTGSSRPPTCGPTAPTTTSTSTSPATVAPSGSPPPTRFSAASSRHACRPAAAQRPAPTRPTSSGCSAST